MRIPLLVTVPAVCLSLTPAMLAAQPSAPPPLYVCTPHGQVLEVNGNTGATVVRYTLTGASFTDCVLGPDGRLYITNGTEVWRLTPSAPADAEAIATLPSAGRGLAFNVSDLYIATASSGLHSLPGVSDVPFGGGPVTSVGVRPLTGAGQGVVFDVAGNLIAATDSQTTAFKPLYSTTAGTAWSISAVGRGVAVDTCGQAIVADRTSKTIKRRAADGTVSTVGGIRFGNKDIPQYLEIDSGNRWYIVTAEDDAGSNAKVWRAEVPFATGGGACAAGASSLTALVSLKASLSGPDRVANLAGSSALGIGIGPTNNALTHRFTDAACSRLYHFGYHTVSLGFTNCAALPIDDPNSETDGYALKITAVKSQPSQVEFVGTFVPAPPGAIEGMRYSPMGGWVVQYQLEPLSGPPPSSFLVKYSFFTQEAIALPGVARSASNDPAALYTESVGTDYWNLAGLGFDPAGERGDDFSKRVVYNSGLKVNGIFTGFEEPLNTGNPLFKTGQIIKVAFRVVDAAGNPVNGGTLRVSVVRIDDPSFPVQTVTSNPQGQPDNVMSSQGNGKYVYNLNTTGYAPGTYMLTIFGDILPINGPNASEYTQKVFLIGQ